MRSHLDIIDDAKGPAKLARAIAADPNTAKQWRTNGSIPAPYWEAIADAGLASLEELAAAAAQRRASVGDRAA